MPDKPLGASDSSSKARGSAKRPPKKELTLDSPADEQLQAIKGLAERFNSDLTSVIGRDNDGKLLHVAVFGRGPYALQLERFLKQIEKEENSLRQQKG